MSAKYASFFVSTEIHKRDVELADGTVHELFLRELPVSMYRKFQIAEQSADEDVRAGSMAKMIVAGLCEPDGSPAMTYEQALNLKPSVNSRIFDAILSLGGDKGKASPSMEKSGSGTSSPSPSAAQQSQNSKIESPLKSSSDGASSTASGPSTTFTDTTGLQP